MKKRIQKKKENKILSQALPHLEHIFEPAIKILQEADPLEYRTNEAKVKKMIEGQIDDEQNAEQFGKAFFELIPAIDLKKHIKEITQNFEKQIRDANHQDLRFSQLYNLLMDADKKCNNIGLMLFYKSNPLETLAKLFEPQDLINEIPSLSGEKANRNIIRLFREVAELLYTDYLDSINMLLQVVEGKSSIKTSNKFGNHTSQLPKRLEKLGYINLVNAEAGWMRNATCHGHWHYNAETDSVVLWDQSKPKQEFSPTDVYHQALEMYTMVVENYLPLMLIYLGKKICSKEWASIFSYLQKNWKAILSEDKKKTTKLGEMIEREFTQLKQIDFK